MLDGNCWMSQNLDFNISTSNVTAATSDVTSNWTNSSTYPPHATSTNILTGTYTDDPLNHYNDTYSWDLGSYVVLDPTATSQCTKNTTGLGACTGQFIATGSRTASTDPNFYQAHKATYTTTEYDAHYLVGNYYEWNAATAGTGGAIANYAMASGSICPRGWKIPDSNSIVKNTFAYLLQQYGLASSFNFGTITGTSGGYSYDIVLSPLFFVRSGYIFSYSDQNNNHGLSAVGFWGHYWSSRSRFEQYSYALLLTDSMVEPSRYNSERYIGRSLRCLLPTT